MSIFKKKFKENTSPNIGDYVICGVYEEISMHGTNKLFMLKGYVEDIFKDNIKVNNEWYKVGYTIGGIYIDSVIKENKNINL